MDDRISRKEFLREAFGFWRKRRADASGPKAGGNPTYRFIMPPGVAGRDAYLRDCDQCYDCVGACPHLALQVCRDETSPLEGYPVIEPRRQPCYLCADFPCIAACPTDALQEAFDQRPLGTAIILEEFCFSFQGSFCQACVNNCPLTGQAIYFNPEGHPEVSAEKCTGCGVCTYSCPAESPAIVIKPNN